MSTTTILCPFQALCSTHWMFGWQQKRKTLPLSNADKDCCKSHSFRILGLIGPIKWVKVVGTQFNDSMYWRRVSASMQLGVNNLPRVVTQPRPAGDRTRDLLIASPTPCHCATTPPCRRSSGQVLEFNVALHNTDDQRQSLRSPLWD